MRETSETEIFNNFLAESTEILHHLEKDVLLLEQNPGNRETVDNIFRNMHSLKGNCSLFGITGIKMMSHSLENLLSRVRDRQIEMDTALTNTLLTGTDHLKSMFAYLIQNHEEGQLQPTQEEYITELNGLLDSGKDENVNESLRIELLKFLNRPEVRERMEKNELARELVTVIRHTAPKLLEERRHPAGEQLGLGEVDVSREYYTVKRIIDEVKTGNTSETHSSAVFGALDSLVEKHGGRGHDDAVSLLQGLKDDLEMLYHDETGFDDVLCDITKDAWEKYRAMVKPVKHEPPPKPIPVETPGLPEHAETIRSRQIKIDQNQLDRTIDMAGELVTISEFFNYLQNQFAEGKTAQNMNSLKDAISSLQELSETLSRDLYDIRKVPIGEAFVNLPRVVRDTQKTLGKQVRLVMDGEDTYVDKSFVPRLETLLVHMIRNSVDHGIETPDERREAGKPEEGTIRLIAGPEGNMLSMTIVDDGRGIDPAKLRKSLVKKGMLDETTANALPEKALYDHIFLPGFSTSDQVTETSGRGVGMDVVLSSIQDIGGTIKLENRAGEGLTLKMTLPFTHTTLVKKGLAVAVGRSVFLIPVEAVIESFRPSPQELFTVEGKNEIIQRRGEIIRLVRLHEMFNIPARATRAEEGIVVLVQRKKQRSCFLVDYVIGQRQIIYKPLAVKTKLEPSPFEGVSVYDGSRLAMILDIEGIIKQSSL